MSEIIRTGLSNRGLLLYGFIGLLGTEKGVFSPKALGWNP